MVIILVVDINFKLLSHKWYKDDSNTDDIKMSMQCHIYIIQKYKIIFTTQSNTSLGSCSKYFKKKQYNTNLGNEAQTHKTTEEHTSRDKTRLPQQSTDFKQVHREDI